MGKGKIKALAHRGYLSAQEIKACDDAGIAAMVPKTQNRRGAKADGRFDRSDFIYIASEDQYLCPAGQRAIYGYTSLESANLQKYMATGAVPVRVVRCSTGRIASLTQ
ncbi:hypothetical protein [Paraburkholderia lycopersici]|uniref:Uncharacterized protein n=1 Tax=Paraburkholderia lycopersici TaxID=416944 RepID=A0A1G6HA67_9BURK|nr:hypothetical protein [Paraburkholderia lycopersici]SDB91111.1 hypothetical protein SAMN05421548_10296 [Paraburkholderia lycopersici]